MEIQRSPCFQHALVITYMWLAHSSLDKVYNYSKIIILFSKWQFDRERKCGAIYPYISVTKYFDNTGELVTATPRAFHTHFIGCWNDAILDIIFKTKAVSIFYRLHCKTTHDFEFDEVNGQMSFFQRTDLSSDVVKCSLSDNRLP